MAQQAQVGILSLAEAEHGPTGELHLIHHVAGELRQRVVTGGALEPVRKRLRDAGALLQKFGQAAG